MSAPDVNFWTDPITHAADRLKQAVEGLAQIDRPYVLSWGGIYIESVEHSRQLKEAEANLVIITAQAFRTVGLRSAYEAVGQEMPTLSNDILAYFLATQTGKRLIKVETYASWLGEPAIQAQSDLKTYVISTIYSMFSPELSFEEAKAQFNRQMAQAEAAENR